MLWSSGHRMTHIYCCDDNLANLQIQIPPKSEVVGVASSERQRPVARPAAGDTNGFGHRRVSTKIKINQGELERLLSLHNIPMGYILQINLPRSQRCYLAFCLVTFFCISYNECLLLLLIFLLIPTACCSLFHPGDKSISTCFLAFVFFRFP